MNQAGKEVVIVTGGAKGIGHIYSLALAKEGYRSPSRTSPIPPRSWRRSTTVAGTRWLSTTPDDVPDPYGLQVQCEVNGTRLQDASTSQVAFSFARIIAELSWG